MNEHLPPCMANSEKGNVNESRREFLGQVSAVGFGAIAAQLLAEEKALANLQTSENAIFAANKTMETIAVKLKINGETTTLNIDSRVTLLDALREKLNLTGTKKGCDHGQCGACTVIVGGRRILSCMTLAMQWEGSEVTTIEGVAKGEELHAMHAAFMKHGGFR